MGRVYSLFVLLFLILQVATANDLWVFGKDVPESKEVFSVSGILHLWDKVKHIQVKVPPCMELIYVRVKVRNLLTSPVVNYNKGTHLVTIAYKILQSSLSSYEVIGKAIPIPYCYVSA